MKTRAKPTSPASARRLLTRREAAEFLGVSCGTLSRWAAERTGPPFVKLTADKNAGVRYPSDLLDVFVTERTTHSK